MHNRKKLDRPPTEAEVAALQKKSQTYASLVGIIFERRRQADRSADTLGLLGKMLRNNPDFYSLWNFRREILQDMHPALVECSRDNKFSAENADQIRDEEMGLSAEGIAKNPKSCKPTATCKQVVPSYASYILATTCCIPSLWMSS
jgi:hypothetical protein